jgi:hypothetical protein
MPGLIRAAAVTSLLAVATTCIALTGPVVGASTTAAAAATPKPKPHSFKAVNYNTTKSNSGNIGAHVNPATPKALPSHHP